MAMLSVTAKRIKAKREEAGLSQVEAAEAIGVHKMTFSRWETGDRNPDGRHLAVLAKMFKVSRAWLSGADEETGALATDPYDEFSGWVSVPMAHAGASPAGVEPKEGEVLRFRKTYLRQLTGCAPEDIRMAVVEGDSMTPTLGNGDLVLVNAKPSTGNRDGLHLVRLDGGLLLKRLQQIGMGMLRLTSDNSTYQPIEVHPREDDFEILGRVVWAGRRL